MDHKEYSSYLLRRSWMGNIYRRYWLYPLLSKFLRGITLDIGCGIGDMLAFRPNTVGVDINAHNISFCMKRGLDAKVMICDQLPFTGTYFDSVLLDNVLEHIASPSALLTEVRRVLRPLGLVIVGVPGLRGYGADTDHKVFYDELDLERLAELNGFKVMRTIHMPIGRSVFLSLHLRQYCIYSIWRPMPVQVSSFQASF